VFFHCERHTCKKKKKKELISLYKGGRGKGEEEGGKYLHEYDPVLGMFAPNIYPDES
jgi:hypothetical protein